MKKSIATMIFCAILPICTENCRGMIPEGFDFFTPIGAFMDWSCDQEGAAGVAGTWTTLVAMFKSENYGGRYCLDEGIVRDIGMHFALRDYFKYFMRNGFYDHSDRGMTGILSKYSDFAETFGNANDPSNLSCYYVAAKNDGEDSSSRRKSDMLNGIGEDFTLNCDGGVGNDRKINAHLQLLLLTEIAEEGTANEGDLDCCKKPFGYNSPMLSKFYKLMSIIME